MIDEEPRIPPQRIARIGGILYAVIIVFGLLEAAVVRERIVVSGNPAATVENLHAMTTLWRLGIASDFVVLSCSVPLSVVFYLLLQPVSKPLALVAVSFNLISLAVEASGNMYLVSALLPTANTAYLDAWSPEQRAAMVGTAMRLYDYAFAAALVFFGWECLILGYLIRRATYLSRSVGVLMQLAGTAYVVNSFVVFLSPALASRLFPLILLPALVGESSLCLWLLFKGVNAAKWEERLTQRARGIANLRPSPLMIEHS
jgi:hypothetical protein